MAIWQREMSLEKLNATNKNTLMETLQIEYTGFDDSSLTASMPVNSQVHQPLGMLHGGASVALAESVGSMAANLAVDENFYCLGLDINANHLKAMRAGRVFAKAEPVHLGKQTQVWSIAISDESGNLVCTSRLTMMVRSRKGDK
ncbi:hotdog fold thioesterase [Thaumasiovibrio subtropicus]|uniref:hotdog fold thioesterase n=1 Tax=Thaumasiovibrio subtropicus TaxID=1891207 RepID=UPI000B358AA8|nr:hotdog fold thioesterase [Thaumasiovibrio subtropicus]